MNNDQFRRLVLQNPSSTRGDSPNQQNASRPAAGSATPGGLLGSRQRANIPMTPRSVTGVDFARQLAEHRREMQPPSKRFKSSAAPKGAKLPSGYVDRAAQLRDENATKEQGDGADGGGSTDPSIEQRLAALEEMVKLGQIDRATFDGLRRELGVGGDTKSTHLVKGLDWDLLRRVKTGEDVSRAEERAESEGKEAEEEVDVDEAFEKLEKGTEGFLPTVPKVKEKKKGNMAPAKRSRDEILRELKASRAAAAAAAAAEKEPALGSRFKRIGNTKEEKKRWVERDEATGRRKEILQITDAEGKTKRKVRWLDKPGQPAPAATTTPDGLLVPEKDAKPLGMEVPADIAAKNAPPPDDDDSDIFEGVGADYNPLADLGDESDSSDTSEDGEVVAGQKKPSGTAAEATPSKEKETEATKPARPRNYFSTSSRDEEPEPERRANPLTSDPTLLAALKRAAALRQTSPSAGEGDEAGDADAETLQRRRKFIEEARRRDELDAMDMDMGFGGSRIEDEEDDEGVLYDENAPKKRKRGPKKRKGDKDSASDVMGVLEGRKKE